MSSSDLLSLFLLPGQTPAYVLLLTAGYIWGPQSIFKPLCFLALFSPLLNLALKAIWLVPLPRNGPVWYAWPSGHVQEATVVYGWLLMHVRSPYLKGSLGALLIALYGAIWAAHFHSISDIIAGLGFGVLLLVGVSSLSFLQSPLFPLVLTGLGMLFVLGSYLRMGRLPQEHLFDLLFLGGLTLYSFLYGRIRFFRNDGQNKDQFAQ